MKVEKHADGRISLLLSPEDEIDSFFLRQFSERVAKGQVIEGRVDSDGRLVLAVEK